MDVLEECHKRLAKLHGDRIEPIEVWQRAEEHRAYWRPDVVRVVLLAESHVYTSKSDLNRTIRSESLVHEHVPSRFVRLVYCLGYGENDLLDKHIASPRNSGTWQFWKIFYSCVNKVHTHDDFAPILVKGAKFADRIVNKMAILRCLKAEGVWLLDASMAALYPRPNEQVVKKSLCESWDCYVGQQVKSARPSHIVSVGIGVSRSLGKRLLSLGVPVTVLPQPNARLTSAEHLRTFQRYYEIVSQAGGSKTKMPSPLEIEFNEAMLDIYRRAKRDAGYKAIRFLQMVTDHGGVETAHILIRAATVSEGYTALWERHRLDLTVESMVIRNERFHELFTSEELEICRNRQREYEQ